MRGRSDIQFPSFELVFDQFRVEIIELGHEPDQISLARKDEAGGEEINYLQRRVASKAGKKEQPSPIRSYADLDTFLCIHHGQIEKYLA